MNVDYAAEAVAASAAASVGSTCTRSLGGYIAFYLQRPQRENEHADRICRAPLIGGP